MLEAEPRALLGADVGDGEEEEDRGEEDGPGVVLEEVWEPDERDEEEEDDAQRLAQRGCVLVPLRSAFRSLPPLALASGHRADIILPDKAWEVSGRLVGRRQMSGGSWEEGDRTKQRFTTRRHGARAGGVESKGRTSACSCSYRKRSHVTAPM